jgi:hypothetical protein
LLYCADPKVLSITLAPLFVAPVKTGAHLSTASEAEQWVPAFAGITMGGRTKII